jgi:ribulose-phosphate 3-epimerase
VEAILPFIEAFDLILVMSVNPGFAGQSFIEDVLEKTRTLAPRLRADQRLQMDGGLNADTAAACREAGCDVLVAASAIFGADDYSRAVASLRGGQRAPAGS